MYQIYCIIMLCIMIQILYHIYILYVYLYTIIVFFSGGKPKHRIYSRLWLFQELANIATFSSIALRTALFISPKRVNKESNLSMYHQHQQLPTINHRKKMAVTKVETLNWRAFALWDPIPSKRQISVFCWLSSEMVWVWYHETSSR